MTLANRARLYLVALFVVGGFVSLVVRLWAIPSGEPMHTRHRPPAVRPEAM